MANTYVDYTGDGTQDTFSITFPFLSNPHVIVKVADVTKTEGTHYNITSGNVVFTSGNEPASAAAVRIQRETEKTNPLVDFKDGSTLLEADLDTATRQSFYISQETDENALRKSGTDWDATSLKITNLGTPTADADASTKSYVDTQVAAKDALSELSGTLDDLTEGTTNKHFTATDETKLDGIESSADVTDTANVTAAGALMDSELTDLAGVKGVTISTLQEKPSEGAFADGDKTKLDGIATAATANDTDANLKDRANHTGTQAASTITSFATEVANTSAVTANTAKETNASHTGDVTGSTALTIADDAVTTAKIVDDAVTGAKLNAALNDLSNVNASPSDGQVLKWDGDSSVWQAGDDSGGGGGGGGISNVSEDTTPQLGGDLDVNGNEIITASGSNGDIAVTPDGTGKVVLDGINWPTADGSADQVLKTDGAGQLSFTAGGSGTVTGVTGASPIVSDGSSTTPAISITDATTSAKGAASFSSDNFAVSSGAVTIKSAGVDLTDEVTGSLPDGNIASASTWNAKIADVVSDTSPQLGGDLDVSSNKIVSASNVGVGTASPSFLVHANSTDTTTAQVDAIGVSCGGATLAILGYTTSGGAYDSAMIRVANNKDLIFVTSNSGLERMRITSGGRIIAKKASNAEVTALTDGATITPDLDDANNFSVTLGGSRTLANPSNCTAGQSGVITITQDGTGSHTLAYGSYWKFSGGTAPTLTTTGSAVDVLAYYVESATRITATLVTDTK